ncbi:hypothetical protein [uncultured Paraglaciecola sp.]|uniref:hypothetical protein n=1 Tax=uncultured Paraglaciecola sp. TaxID=1765024 RepID=UPI0026041B48|nr:hypothetical protein [uncultured Paraglaciecola sp.]
MIITFTNYSDVVDISRVGLELTIELTIKTFPRLQTGFNSPVSYAMDRKSYRATNVSDKKTGSVTFCKIPESQLPNLDELIESIGRREYMQFDNQGHPGHKASYLEVLCTAESIQPTREGRFYILSMPIEVFD